MGLYLLESISFYYATSIGIEWLREVSTEYVRPIGWLVLYPVFMFFSLLSFYLSYNANTCAILESFDEKLLKLIGIELDL